MFGVDLGLGKDKTAVTKGVIVACNPSCNLPTGGLSNQTSQNIPGTPGFAPELPLDCIQTGKRASLPLSLSSLELAPKEASFSPSLTQQAPADLDWSKTQETMKEVQDHAWWANLPETQQALYDEVKDDNGKVIGYRLRMNDANPLNPPLKAMGMKTIDQLLLDPRVSPAVKKRLRELQLMPDHAEKNTTWPTGTELNRFNVEKINTDEGDASSDYQGMPTLKYKQVNHYTTPLT